MTSTVILVQAYGWEILDPIVEPGIAFKIFIFIPTNLAFLDIGREAIFLQ